ncbi:UDP-2,3-diacylglucosamine diphosphatase [Salinisphaera sp. G21_0]|uniref:UDP-2,3-diacylglucosamine diphosphatase n=1 Tax=Salinisphaera sp. G21_0 TaxID=2821094 RepID=UPI001ADD0CC9|nr:UDP-2,3-diacylglucosamine diphosphatase [Salinisphaera sp. G21_0]MBO9479946.1 UDP-2,3-diacylglucosamine diphosphatase [Salinisphaera sp. G21_0]
MKALFISDLHLTPECPAVARAFCHYLADRAPQADALYILGDFFEYWVGDDAMDDFQHDIAQRLRQYTNSGKALYLMPGNRDFAIGKSFLQATGAQWLKDPTLITINNQKILLMHGDSLCTADKQYQRYRKIIRNPLVMALLRMTPLSYRKNLGRKIRQKSKAAKIGKALDIMDVTRSEVVEAMERFGVDTLIHGHTHRPDIHEVALKHGVGKRYVLGDWTDKGWEIELDSNGITLDAFPIKHP